MNSKSIKVGELYMQMLRANETAGKSVDFTEKVKLLQDAALTGLQIIERLALLTAATDANLTAFDKSVSALNEKNPELFAQLDANLGGLMGCRDVLSQIYEDEIDFSRRFELMVRERMLTEAGIDPKDTEKATAWLLEQGKAMPQAAAARN